jgi:hypothetical protein
LYWQNVLTVLGYYYGIMIAGFKVVGQNMLYTSNSGNGKIMRSCN